MTFDLTHPFHLDVEPNDIEVVVLADTPAAALDVYVHSMSPDGSRVVSATLGEFTVMYRTAVTPEQYGEVAAAAEAYDADPAAGWANLRARLAAENLGTLDTTLTSDPDPYRLLRFASLDDYDHPLAAAPAHFESSDQGHVVRMPVENGRGFTRLYAGTEDPTDEVARFNDDPVVGFAKLWAAAVTERVEKRRAALEALAAAQVRDLRMVERSLRTRRATGGDA